MPTIHNTSIATLNELINRIKETVDSHLLDKEGKYARWLWNDEEGSRRLGINEYGCADAANILYTIGEFIGEPAKRQCWIDTLKGLQDPQTGLYTEETHHPIHTTAHCIAALELFDAKPDHPLTGFSQYATKEGLYALLESLDWHSNPWPQSHQSAGIYAAMVLTDTVDADWSNWYFDWFWQEADPATGLWRKGFAGDGGAPLSHHMAGSFHYLFNHEYAKMPLRYPERMIDSCIQLYEDKAIREDFGQFIGFLEIDWSYCINRASRQTPYRFADCKAVLRKFAKEYIEYLYSLDHKTHDGFNDLHMLFGSVCALAELSCALPGELETKRPLKLVLDRRPFI